MVAAASRLLDAPPASITGGLPAAPAARRPRYAQVAQLVEHCTENAGVGGSIPPLGTILTLFANHCHCERGFRP